jgi:hypothetical protein
MKHATLKAPFPAFARREVVATETPRADKMSEAGKVLSTPARPLNTSNLIWRSLMPAENLSVDPAPVKKSERALARALALLGDETFTIDDGGRIWRNAINVKGKRFPIEPRRAESPTYKGYLAVVMGDPKTRGRTYKVYAHVLIWTWHNGPIPAGLQVNHKNLNKSDNALDNLELLTGAGNIQHSYANGRPLPFSTVGYISVTPETKQRIRDLRASGRNIPQIAAETGVSKTHVHRIISKPKGGVE